MIKGNYINICICIKIKSFNKLKFIETRIGITEWDALINCSKLEELVRETSIKLSIPERAVNIHKR